MSDSLDTIDTLIETTLPGKKSAVETSALLWWRRISQLIFLAVIGQWSFYGIFRCPFIVPFVSCENCPVITCHGRLLTLFWGFWLFIPLSVLFFGRAFCSWACPGGLIHQLFGYFSLFKSRLRHAVIKGAAYFKLVGLVLVLYVLFALDQPRMAIPIRVGEFYSSVLLTFEHADLMWLIRSGFVLGFLAFGMLMANAWCRFACPTGGLLEMLKGFSLFKVIKTSDCNHCNQCLKICEMGTRPAEFNCTNCCDCLTACPQNAIQLKGPVKKDPGKKSGERY